MKLLRHIRFELHSAQCNLNSHFLLLLYFLYTVSEESSCCISISRYWASTSYLNVLLVMMNLKEIMH